MLIAGLVVSPVPVVTPLLFGAYVLRMNRAAVRRYDGRAYLRPAMEIITYGAQ